MHHSWDRRGNAFAVSRPRSRDPEKGRWAGIETSRPLIELPANGDGQHPGEEGLALARVELAETPVLVACSVLPWRGADDHWNELPKNPFDQFRMVLDHHVARITAERMPAEPLIWGGDSNQPLVPPFAGGSVEEALLLRSTLDHLGLTSLTQGLAHRNGQMYAVEHLAVSPDFLGERVEVHRPVRDDGSNMSGHAAYIADVQLIRA